MIKPIFKLLILVAITLFANQVRSQLNDSIFPELNSFDVDICLHAWDFEGMSHFEYLTVSSDTPFSDTLRIKDQGNVLAHLWIDGRKTWLKVDSMALYSSDYFYMFEGIYENDYPLDEYFVLYDFNDLDLAAIGDTMRYVNSRKDVEFVISSIDTIVVNTVQRVRYEVYNPYNDQVKDYLVENLGGHNPISPILTPQGFYGMCTCNYDVTFANATDTLYLEDENVFGDAGNYCLSAGLSKDKIKVKLKVFPNPVSGNSFTIDADKMNSVLDVSLVNPVGQEVQMNYIFNEEEDEIVVTFRKKSTGLYILLLKTKEGLSRFKVLVN